MKVETFPRLPESIRLQQDLEKVQQLEGKITSELTTLKEQISTMESDLHTYRDLDTLRHTAEERKKVALVVSGTQILYCLHEALLQNGLTLNAEIDGGTNITDSAKRFIQAAAGGEDPDLRSSEDQTAGKRDLCSG